MHNPVIAASGSFGYGKEFEEFYDINRLGAFSFKGTTFEPRFGNNTPRIAECDSGMLISIGLQNPGVHAVAEKELPRLKESYHKKVLANVCGFTPEEYRDIIEVLENCEARDIIGWYEVNISCPNVSEGGSWHRYVGCTVGEPCEDAPRCDEKAAYNEADAERYRCSRGRKSL